MKIIVNESQYKKIIVEETTKNIKEKFKNLKEFFKSLTKKVKEQVGLDLNFLSTWGVTIAGFVRPLSDFMEGKYPELTSTEIALLSTGIILTYFHSNREMLGEVLNRIKEKGLIQEFDDMLDKAKELKDAFLNFIDSLAIPISKVANMMAYCFLIPIVPELYEFAQGGGDMSLSEIAGRIGLYLGTSIFGNLIKTLIKAIVKRFKS